MDWNLGTAARTLWQEARGEPIQGQQAVAHVIFNRLKDGRWGTALASVCLWHAGFSGWFSPRVEHGIHVHDPNFAAACALGDSDPQLLAMAAILQSVINGAPDFTFSATHYYAKASIEPTWVDGDPAKGIPAATFCGQFGKQLFYKGVQ